MSANQAGFPIAAMARMLGVSKAGYYAWLQRPASAHATADAALLKRVRTIHASSRQTYGAPRIHADLRGRGERHSRKRIARLMREAGLVGASHRRGGPITTRRDKDARPAPDLVDRNFTAAGPNQLCVKRRAIGTPDRHLKGTPLVGVFRACPGSEQEGPARSGVTATSLTQRSAGGTCLPTWASPGGGVRGGGFRDDQARCLKRQLSLPVSTISQ
jgi:hypothetical protein